VRLLITGISGFIGGSFGSHAAKAGHVVMGTGRSDVRAWSGLYTRIHDADDLSHLIREFLPDVLVNAAGTASVAASLNDPLNDFHGSVETCAKVLDAVRRSGNDPLIVIPSSAAAYGNPTSVPVSEDASLQPISPYGFHKAACELLSREYAECFGLRIVICRFFSVFGPAQCRLLVWELYKQLAGDQETAWLEGTGSESRDFLYIDDAVAALLGLARDRVQNPSAQSIILNVGSGIETSVIGLAEQLRDLVAPQKEIRCRGVIRKGDPLRWCADISRLRACLPSWQPRPLREGLVLCVKAWQQQARFSQYGS
jgi:nucleoside-diphosphate-sugar epimerase